MSLKQTKSLEYAELMMFELTSSQSPNAEVVRNWKGHDVIIVIAIKQF